MNSAKAAGYFIGENPARLDVLRNLLPQRPRKAVKNHPAMPWRDVQAFMVELKGKELLSAGAGMDDPYRCSNKCGAGQDRNF
jgi:hypothetical protein